MADDRTIASRRLRTTHLLFNFHVESLIVFFVTNFYIGKTIFDQIPVAFS